jgi:mono/diheme cytochrome c family protein
MSNFRFEAVVPKRELEPIINYRIRRAQMKCKQGVYRFLSRFMFICAATLALASCGGGGGSSSTPAAPATPTLTGLAATGAALAGAGVTAKCASGPSVAGTTGADGTFSLPLAAGQAVPCLLEVVSGAVTLHGFAVAVGYTNVTPLTELVIIRALGSSAVAAFASFDASKGASIKAGLDDAKAYVIAQVTPLAGAPSVDILTGVFKVDDNDADDKVLVKLKTALDDSGKKLDDFGNAAASGGSLTAVVTRQTWYFADGAALTPSQIASFDNQGLYYNVHSAANPSGEIRDQIKPSSTTFVTDNGALATSNTFSALLSGAQEVPASTTKATAYGTVVLDPVAKTIRGVIVTSGIVGILAHIHNGVPGVSGPVIFPFTGGPTVWTLASTAITDAQITDLKSGAYYLNVHSTAAPGGEIRGQLTQQLRFAKLDIANEPSAKTPALPSSGVAVLALSQTANASGNFPISGFVQTTGIVDVTAAHIHEGPPGPAGPVIVPIAETPAGSGFWIVPAGSTLTPAQVVSFNAGNLYYNVHTKLNPGGEIRGAILPATIKIGTAALEGSKEVPPVTTDATGTGIITVNSVTMLVQGNISTSGIVGTLAHVHEDPVNLVGPVIVPMTLTPPASTFQAPLSVTTTALAGGTVGSAYSQTLAATGGTAPYTWTVSVGTLPAGLNLTAAGLISGPPTTAGTSSFTVTVSDSATPVATVTKALSIDIAAAAAATVSFASQIQPIFNASCVVCHVQGGLATFMPLSAGTAYASLFQASLQAGLLRVVAGNSAASPLYLRIIGSSIGNQMPLGGAPLSAGDQTLIKNWIDQGAPNN